jgi:hypothetical protein
MDKYVPLNLDKCFIGEEGAKAIVKSKWKKLEKLMISTLRSIIR